MKTPSPGEAESARRMDQETTRVGDALRSAQPAYESTFIRRDYHRGNILWDGNHVSGVVDWATAAPGPPCIDLARIRLNLSCRQGRNLGHRFAEAYVAAGANRQYIIGSGTYWMRLTMSPILSLQAQRSRKICGSKSTSKAFSVHFTSRHSLWRRKIILNGYGTAREASRTSGLIAMASEKSHGATSLQGF